MKKVLKQAGGFGKETTFLFTEGQIKEEAFLQDIDSLLNSGEVPNIYAIDEQQEILEVSNISIAIRSDTTSYYVNLVDSKAVSIQAAY